MIAWEESVPIEQLRCQSCGYRLFGLAEPRCPECGRSFTWEEALLDVRRRRSMLFEYRWRDRPVRSFLWTWFHALRPKKFWSSLSIDDPPRMKPLIWFVSLLLTLSALLVILGQAAVALTQYLWWFIQTSSLPWWAVVLRALAYASSDGGPWAAAGFFATYGLASWAALLIFQQSMRRYKVPAAQVTRTCAYTVLILIPFYCLAFHVQLCLHYPYYSQIYWWIDYLETAEQAAIYGFVIWSLHKAYKHYLQMDHSFGVAVCSQIIAGLLTLTVFELSGNRIVTRTLGEMIYALTRVF